MSNIFPFVQLKFFENGWRYSGKLKEFLKHKYHSSLAKINDSEIKKISTFLKGNVLESRIFKNFAWVLFLHPVPNLEIYIFCERSSKAGDNFTIFFGKGSSIIPVEEIYGFALIYISMLALIGKNSISTDKILLSDKFIKFPEKHKGHSLLMKRQSVFTKPDMDKLIKNIGMFPIITDYNFSKDTIELIVKPVDNMVIKYIYNADSKKILISETCIKIYPENLIVSFASLICKSIAREFSKVDKI